MGGIFGTISQTDCVMDVFFGTDYHSHLGTKKGGMCILGRDGFDRSIHNISNSAFRSKFEKEIDAMAGHFGIGAISDGDPQPLTAVSHHGEYAVTTVGRINNKEDLLKQLLENHRTQFMTMNQGEINSTELVAALIAQGKTLVEGIQYAQEKIDGSCSLLVLTKEALYAARDKWGRTPLIIGKKGDQAYCAASESFAFINLGYKYKRELGPGEIVRLTPREEKTLVPPGKQMKVCAFLWTYFGYTTSIYEGKNVELMRNRNGAIMAETDRGIEVDYVAGVPDSGVAHALGYANGSQIPYARPLIKYTPTWPRSFMPQHQGARNLIAKMKLVPVFQIIHDKKFVLVDDSIVRGTQLSETVAYLLENGAKAIHVRSACPPIMFGCKYLNFSRSVSDMELLTRRCIAQLEGLGQEAHANPKRNGGCLCREIPLELLKEYADSHSDKHKKMIELMREKLKFDSLKFQELEHLLEAIGIEKEKICTYCWNGEE